MKDLRNSCSEAEIKAVESTAEKGEKLIDLIEESFLAAIDIVQELINDTINEDPVLCRENKLLMIQTNGAWAKIGMAMRKLNVETDKFESALLKTMRGGGLFDRENKKIVASIYADILFGLAVKGILDKSEDINDIVRG